MSLNLNKSTLISLAAKETGQSIQTTQETFDSIIHHIKLALVNKQSVVINEIGEFHPVSVPLNDDELENDVPLRDECKVVPEFIPNLKFVEELNSIYYREQKEQRSEPRHSFIQDLTVRNSSTGDELGNLADLSKAGILIISENQIDLGKTILIQIDIPNSLSEASQTTFEAQCIRCAPTIHDNLYSIAFQITAIDNASESVLEELIHSYGIS